MVGAGAAGLAQDDTAMAIKSSQESQVKRFLNISQFSFGYSNRFIRKKSMLAFSN
jgi:hypothetical protein